MKYKYGKYMFDKNMRENIYIPRIYTDFYCSLDEWRNLGKGKENFMYQLRSHIVSENLMNDKSHCETWEDYIDDKFLLKRKNQSQLSVFNEFIDVPEYIANETDYNKINTYLRDGVKVDDKLRLKFKHPNGLWLYELSFDRTGRRDDLESEIYSAEIIKHVIKFITHKDADVEFFSWKGTIDHVEISFNNCEMPNIIVLIDSYEASSTNRTLIHCVDAIYKTLRNKASFYYDDYHKPYYNNEWDKIFNYTEEEFIYSKDDYPWNDTYRLKANRIYDKATINYK